MPKRGSIPAEPVADPDRIAEELVQEHGASPEDFALAEDDDDEIEPPHDSSLTAIAAETARTGVHPERELGVVPGQDDLLRAGDPGVDPLGNLHSDDPAPDQNDVDEIARAAGLTAEDDERLSGQGLRSPAELLDERDAHRWELDPRSSNRPGDDAPARKRR